MFRNLLSHNGWLQGCQHWVKPGFEAGNGCAESCKVHHSREEEHHKVHHLEGEGTPTGPAKFLPWQNRDYQEPCKPAISVYVGRQTLTLPMWNLPVTTYKVTLAMLGSEFVLKGLSPCYRWQLLLCHTSPQFILKTSLIVWAISASRSLWVVRCVFFHLLWFWGNAFWMSMLQGLQRIW